MKTCKKVLAFAFALVMLFACVACGGNNSGNSNNGNNSSSDSNSGDAAVKDSLNIRIPDEFYTLDPHNWSLDSDFTMIYQIYEPLIRLDDESNEIPVLATGYTMAEDGSSCTFTLAEGVTFSNGDVMTATDVQYSFERTKASAYQSSLVDTVESVTADDAANTVTVNFSTPTPGFIDSVSKILVVNKAFTEANMDENGMLGFNVCGTGPYTLKEYTRDASVTLEVNPNFRGEAPSIKTLTFHLITDENTAFTALKAGDLDIARLDSANWNSLAGDPNYQTGAVLSNHVTYMVMNVTKAPFDNPLVRQAIACATNRDDIIAMTQDGMAVPTYTVATSQMVGYAEIEPQFTYDVDRAKDLLTQAGYPNGLDIGEIQVLAGTYFADVAVVLQQQLAAVGITSTITSLDGNALIANCFGGNFGMATMGQTNMYDMSWVDTYYSSSQIGSMNMAAYSNAEMDSMLAAAGSCMDPDERVAMYKEILEKADEECAYLCLFNKTTGHAWAKDLNYTPTARTAYYADCSWN